jgi:hypothetical protein
MNIRLDVCLFLNELEVLLFDVPHRERFQAVSHIVEVRWRSH